MYKLICLFGLFIVCSCNYKQPIEQKEINKDSIIRKDSLNNNLIIEAAASSVML